MIQDYYQKAMKFAGEKHSDQLVPGTNANYLLHISNVAMEIIMAYQVEPTFDLESAIQIAILHDTLEDTDATHQDIQELFGKKVADGVHALTKDDSRSTKSDKMEDSLNRISMQPKEVALVKLADRITNLQEPPAHWNLEKRQRYLEEATVIAERLKGFQSYLDQRIRFKIEHYQRYCQQEI